MADINVTPLVDVMLVLLIIFMITAPMLSPQDPVDLPQPNPNVVNPPTPLEPIRLKIDPSRRVVLERHAGRRTGSQGAVAVIAQQSNQPEIQIAADRRRSVPVRRSRPGRCEKLQPHQDRLYRRQLIRFSRCKTRTPRHVRGFLFSCAVARVARAETAQRRICR